MAVAAVSILVPQFAVVLVQRSLARLLVATVSWTVSQLVHR